MVYNNSLTYLYVSVYTHMHAHIHMYLCIQRLTRQMLANNQKQAAVNVVVRIPFGRLRERGKKL